MPGELNKIVAFPKNSSGDRWIETYIAEELAHLDAKTQDAYSRVLKDFTAWVAQRPGSQGHFAPSAMTKTAVSTYFNEKKAEKSRWICMMDLHARWYGEWSTRRKAYRWQSLEWACIDLEVVGNGYHRAMNDALNTLMVMRTIANRAGRYPPPNDRPYHQRFFGE